MTKYKKGKIVKGIVRGIESYGIFISFDEYYSGLIHISEISHGFVKNIHDYVQIGDTIRVEVLEADEDSCHLKLSIKNIDYKNQSNRRKQQIKQTPLGFKTLAYHLPHWIERKVKKSAKNMNSIDK